MGVQPWDPTTREGRIAALRHFLTTSPYARSGLAVAFRERLEGLTSGKSTAEDEAVLFRDLRNAFQRDTSLFGRTWRGYSDAVDAAITEAKEKGAHEDALVVSTTGHLTQANRLAANFVDAYEEYLNLARDTSPTLRLRLLMESIMHLANLVRDVLYRTFRPRTAGRSKTEIAELREKFLLIDDTRVRAFLNFGFVADLPVPLGELRHWWAHGDATVTREGVVVYEENSDKQRAVLSERDLQLYIDIGIAVYYVYAVEGMVVLSQIEAHAPERAREATKSDPHAAREE